MGNWFIQNEVWEIRYTHSFTGLRKSYMNIHFQTKAEAMFELLKIKQRRKELKGMGYYLNRSGGSLEMNRVCTMGKNFRVRKIIINTRKMEINDIKPPSPQWLLDKYEDLIKVDRDNYSGLHDSIMSAIYKNYE